MNVLGLGLGLTHNAGAAAAAIFNAFPDDPSASDRFLIGLAVRSLQASGLWYRLDCLHVYAAATSGNAVVNWVSPGTRNAVNNGSTFTAYKGFTTDAVSLFVDTGFNPTSGSPKFAQNDASAGFWCLDNAQVAASGFGWFDGTDGLTITPRNTSNQMSVRTNSATLSTVSNSTGNGFFSTERTDSTHNRLLMNGVSLQTPNTTSAAVNNHNFNVGNVSSGAFAAHQCAMDFIGSSLGAGVAGNSAAAHLAFYNIMLAYMQGVGAV